MDQTDETENEVSAITSTKDTFEFFNLPRELRDKVYDETLTGEKTLPTSKFRMVARVRNLPYRNLLLVGRKFKHELLERATKSTCLVLIDQKRYSFGTLDPPPLVLARHAAHVELHLILNCYPLNHDSDIVCFVRAEFAKHREGLMKFVEGLENLRSLSVKLYLWPHPHTAEYDQAIQEHEGLLLAEAISTGRLSSFEVYRWESVHGSGEDWPSYEDKTRVMTYSHEEHKLLRVEKNSGNELDAGVENIA